MPTKKTAKKKPAKRKTKTKSPDCFHCDHLPLKSGELVAILVCLVVSLSAVLLTSMTIIEDQQHQIAQYQELFTRR